MTAVELPSDELANELPEGWATTTIGEICPIIQYGYTAPATEGVDGPRFLRITDIQDGKVDWDSVPTCRIDLQDRTKFQLRGGDIVFARTGATTGKSFLIRSCPESVFASYLIRVRPHPYVDPPFLSCFFGTPEYWQLVSENVAGNAQPNCNASKLAALSLPLPPLAEQRRIVEKVESLLARVNVARERLARVPAILDRFRQSVVAAACSGRLTEDWRLANRCDDTPTMLLERILSSRRSQCSENSAGSYDEPIVPGDSRDSELPEQWVDATIDQLTCLVTSGSRGWARFYSDTGPLFIRAQNINTDELRLDDIAHVQPPDTAEGRRTRVKFGDLLITITGANVTKAAVVHVELPMAYVSQHVALVRPVDVETSRFLWLWTVSPAHGRAKLLEDAYGAGKPGINLDNIRELIVGLPSLEEQREIVCRVKALFKLADTIEQRVAAAAARVGKLTQAILAKAIRGELVPTEAELARCEGREYEPASVLLERIRAERKGISDGAAQRKSRSGKYRGDPESDDATPRRAATSARPRKRAVRSKSR